MLSSEEIRRIIPHRYPFLLVDRVLELSADRAVGLKHVTNNEPFFQGHFPEYAVMPGVLIAEAAAQVGAVAVLSQPAYQGRLAFLAGLDGWRFKRQVTPGDTLTIEVTLAAIRRGIGKGHARVSVEGNVAAEGDLLFAIGPAPTQDSASAAASDDAAGTEREA
ncbi:MAG TPA: 3-hydroxyacyl-ACP dehydratase FabZ [Ktedonobacterales bacterium]